MDGNRPVDGECAFCGRELPSDPVRRGDGARFCSPGCRDVDGTLEDGNGTLEDASRDGTGTRDRTRARDRTDALDDGSVPAETGDSSTAESTPERAVERTFLRVDGMHDVTCEAYLESVASDLSGVSDAEASYVTETVRVDHDPAVASKSTLRDALTRTGYTAFLREEAEGARAEGTRGEATGGTRRSREMSGLRKRRTEDMLDARYIVGVVFGGFILVPYAVLLYPFYLGTMLDGGVFDLVADPFRGDGGLTFLRTYFLLTGAVLYFTGKPLLRGAYVSLRMRRPNTDLLVALAMLGAYLYGTLALLVGNSDVYYDLAILIAAVVMGAVYYETAVKRRTMDRLTELTVSQVDAARVYDGDGTREVPVDDVGPGDRVLVRQGERVPVDGALAEGECTVAEAVVTGESLPVAKRAGDDVVGGSIVTNGAAVVDVGDEASSSIDRIREAVWTVQSGDHGVHRRADRLAGRALPIVLGLAAAAGVGALALGAAVPEAVLASTAALVVASPWALGFATPLSVASCLESALDRGIVVFDGTIFERLRDVDVVAFDKTGTLTTGRMDVIDADAPEDLLTAAAALERRASHPAAEAIVDAFGRARESEDDATRADGGVGDASETGGAGTVEAFETHATGVGGSVGGTEVLVGNLELFADRGWSVDEDVADRAREARGAGRLPVVVGREGRAEGIVVVGDDPREGWDETVSSLAERGIEVVVLTGDDEAAAESFGRHPGVDHAFAGVPPAGKTETIRRLRSRGTVTMVGDGTNDAPALAAADLGVSLGGGTALASDAADIAVVEDDLSAVETAFDLARAAGERVERNERLALCYNAVAIPLAVAGLLNPLLAVGALTATTVLVAANSERALLDD